MLRFFIDSSVLFAACYSARGLPWRLIEAAIRGDVLLVVSDFVLVETWRNLESTAPQHLDDLRTILLRVPFEDVKVSPRLVKTASRAVELKDAPIVAAAKKAKVDALVTFDFKHLLRPPAPAACLKAPIITPQQAMAQLSDAAAKEKDEK
jgi:predicted nucleic acid-binding protein